MNLPPPCPSPKRSGSPFRSCLRSIRIWATSPSLPFSTSTKAHHADLQTMGVGVAVRHASHRSEADRGLRQGALSTHSHFPSSRPSTARARATGALQHRTHPHLQIKIMSTIKGPASHLCLACSLRAGRSARIRQTSTCTRQAVPSDPSHRPSKVSSMASGRRDCTGATRQAPSSPTGSDPPSQRPALTFIR